MPYLIDGDNLLHAARAAFEGAEHASRAWLCGLLAVWSADQKQGVTIVFDGFRPDAPGEGPLAAGALSIRYSDKGTADGAIIETLESSSAARRLTIVSSDREVRTAARRRRATSVDSPTFIERVRRDLTRSERTRKREPREKYEGLEPGETERWLEEFGIGPDANDGEDDLWLM